MSRAPEALPVFDLPQAGRGTGSRGADRSGGTVVAAASIMPVTVVDPTVRLGPSCRASTRVVDRKATVDKCAARRWTDAATVPVG